jgi:cytochrome c553
MQKSRLYGLLTLGAALAGSVTMAQTKAPAPISAQAQRGKDFFIKTNKGVACGTCHQVGGVGTAVGPDLTKLAGPVGARGIISTIQMSMTAYVQEYKTKEGDFVGIPKEGTSNSQIWDLTDNKPALKEMKAGDITSQKQNEKWKHPPATATYTPQELADLIAWLKYASTGKNVEIKVSDVQ